MYPWLKAFHLISVVTWFAGLFYLPRLFVYHAMAEDAIGRARFEVMERKLYRGIMTPSLIVVVAMGLGLVAVLGLDWFRATAWLHVKLALVAILVGYHFYLGRLMRRLRIGENRHSHVFYRWINEFPVMILVGTVLLAVLKPALFSP
ncbi:MAG: protoporphyrinogen oxidase HemJ [Gammaproteobacteria bacterium]